MLKSEINQQKEVTNELVIKLRDLAKRIDNMAFKLELENNTEIPSKAYIGEYKSKIERHAIEIIKAL